MIGNLFLHLLTLLSSTLATFSAAINTATIRQTELYFKLENAVKWNVSSRSFLKGSRRAAGPGLCPVPTPKPECREWGIWLVDLGNVSICMGGLCRHIQVTYKPNTKRGSSEERGQKKRRKNAWWIDRDNGHHSSLQLISVVCEGIAWTSPGISSINTELPGLSCCCCCC